MISANSIQEIRDRADILEVIGHFLSLKRRGVNYIANCPFHNEKTPSFNVNPAKGIFKCFGCGKAGDTVTFIQEYEKFSFVEAIRWLADFYKIELEETQAPEEQVGNRHKEESLRILFEFAAKYFEDNLWNTEEGNLIGLSYYKERGLTDAIIRSFRLGYAADSWNHFYEHAIKSGYTEDLLIQSGLVSKKADRAYDTYRARVIFPILSNTGRVVGFGARILNNQVKAPKYINSPENEVYNKSKILYGLYQSRTAIGKLDECYLVEGYTDVISLHQHGVENVVSSSGTSLTEGQLKLMKNLSRNLTILYDGDAAGVKAALRGMQMALSESYNVHIVLLPEGEDPDSFVQKNGASAFRDYIQGHKRDVIDFQIDLALSKGTLSLNEKSQLTNEIAETISKVNKAEDFVLQQEYTKKAAGRLQIDEAGLITLVNKLVREHSRTEQKKWEPVPSVPSENTDIQQPAAQPAAPPEPVTGAHRDEWKVLQTLLRFGDKEYLHPGEKVADYFFNTYDLDSVENELCKTILTELEALWKEQKVMDLIVLHFIRHQNVTVKNKVIELLLEAEQPNPKWESEFGIKLQTIDDIYIEECKSVFAYFELNVLQKLIREVMNEIKENKGSSEEIIELMKVQLSLKEQEKSLLNLVIRKPLQ